MAVKLMEILVSVVAVLVWATHIVMMPMVVLSELCVVAGVPLHHVRVVVVVDHVSLVVLLLQVVVVHRYLVVLLHMDQKQ